LAAVFLATSVMELRCVPSAFAGEADIQCIHGAHWVDEAPAFASHMDYEACIAADKIGTAARVCHAEFMIKNGTRVSVHGLAPGLVKDAPAWVMVTPIEGRNAGHWGIVGADDLQQECPPKTKPTPKATGKSTKKQGP
jgi:hypothetical protein